MRGALRTLALVVLGLAARAGAARPDALPDPPDSVTAPADTLPARAPERPTREPLDLAAFDDTLGIRYELGARADLTNEEFVSYDDAFLDTTFQVRRLVGTPERRYAGVATMVLQGTRNARATRYELRNDLSLGDLVQRDALGLVWRSELGADWTVFAAPFLEYRHDRTFDRDREEYRATMNARVRRELRVATTFAEAGTRLETVRTRGRGVGYLLDCDAATLALALDHLGLLGDEWRVDYALTGRVFPDSATRDHVEQAGGVTLRRDFGAGHVLALDGRLLRRSTVRPADVSRDNYWTGEGGLEADVRTFPGWMLRARVEGDAIRYDVEDDTVFFDFHVARARLGARYEGDPRWSATLGPRLERLYSRRSPSDSYLEIAGALELEVLTRGAWWSVTPAAGRRRYDETSGPDALLSSFDFFEIGVFADQPLGSGLRLRGLGAWRYESHDDDTQDARSLYLSIEAIWAPPR